MGSKQIPCGLLHCFHIESFFYSMGKPPFKYMRDSGLNQQIAIGLPGRIQSAVKTFRRFLY